MAKDTSDDRKVYADLLLHLQAQNVMLTPGAAKVAITLYEESLGQFMRTDPHANDARFDIWDDKRFTYFRQFVLDRVMTPIAERIKKGGPGTVATIRTLVDATADVVGDPTVKADCLKQLDRLAIDQGIPLSIETAVCGDLDPLTPQQMRAIRETLPPA